MIGAGHHKTFMTTIETIFSKTNQGLDIILKYFPEAEQGVRNKNFKFKIRDEKTASAVLMFVEKKQKYVVVDHGSSDKKQLDGLNIVMMEEKIVDEKEAIKFILAEFKIETEGGIIIKPKAKYSRRDAKEGEFEKADFWETKEASIAEMKTIFAQKTWLYLCKKQALNEDKNSDKVGQRHGEELFARFGLSALKSYSQVRFLKDDKGNPTDRLVVHTFESTETYPIFMYDEGKWKKFYQPKHEDKSRRFHSFGQKPPKYTFGIADVRRAFNNLNPDSNSLDEPIEDDVKIKKLPEIIICSGGSDALNVAALGYHVVWFNSETVNKTDIPMTELRKMAYRVCYLPDIDSTGIEVGKALSLEYLDLNTIWLPEPTEKDEKKWKDVKDWLQTHTSFDFKNLLKDAKPMRFWSESVMRDRKGEIVEVEGVAKMKYTPHPVLINNYLQQHGYCKVQLSDNAEDEAFIKIEGNIVADVTTNDMRNELLRFIQSRHLEIDLQAALMRSKDASDATFNFIKKKELNFTDFDKDSQLFFFTNTVWRVTCNGIAAQLPTESKNFVWAKEVIPHEVTLKPAPFKIFKNSDDEWDIEIIDDSCLFLRFLINTSRTHWRTELETRLDDSFMSEEQKAEYRIENKFKIDGPLLSKDEIMEQKRHLISKLVALGYLLHRFKKSSAARAIFAMDYVMDNTDESNGGTGKSMIGRALKDTGLMPYKFVDGRKDDMKNPHLFEGITEHTDLLWFDDIDKKTNIEMFFSTVDNDLTVNPKGKKGYTVPFDVSPKPLFTSNYPPFSLSSSSMRRLWFVAFSDFYHYNKENKYRSHHDPFTDFGKDLFRDFDATEWNDFYNMVANCCQSYIQHGRIEPPMDILMSNAYRNRIGASFLNWANLYFDKENGTLDCLIPRIVPFEMYRQENHTDIYANGFKDKMEMWCKIKNYELNPKGVKGHRDDGRVSNKAQKPYWDSKDKKWAMNGEKVSVEFFYIQTPKTDLTDKYYFSEI